MFVEACLPSLLSPGNLPALARAHDVRVVLHCPSADFGPIEALPGVRSLRGFAEVELVSIDRHDLSDHLAAHTEIWHREMNRARGEDMVITHPPDSVLSDSSLSALARLLDEGKRCIFAPTTLRVVDDGFLAALGPHVAGGAISIPARDLVSLSLRHLHPFSAAQVKDSPYFTSHPELVFWPLKGFGFLGHCLASHPFAVSPRLFPIKNLKVDDFGTRSDAVHVVHSSDEMFIASIAPLDKDFHWFSVRRRANPVRVGSWWRDFESRANDHVARQPFLLIWRQPGARRLERTSKAASLFVQRSVAAREAHKVWRAALELQCFSAARLIATAMCTGVILRTLAACPEQRFDVYLPIDSALEKIAPSLNSSVLEDLIRRCVVPTAPGRHRGLDPRSLNTGRYTVYPVGDIPAARSC